MTETKTSKTLEFAVILAIMLVVSATLFPPISSNLKLIIRLVLLAVFFVSWRIFHRAGNIKAKDLAFAFLALNLAFLIFSFFPTDIYNLNHETSRGFALLKLSDAVIISAILILTFIFSGYSWDSIFLAKGQLVLGLIIGLIFFIAFGYLAINNPEHKMEPGFIQRNYKWILIYVLSSGFMEEFLYRGIFLEKLNAYFHPVWSIILLSICFAAPHLMVNFTHEVLIFSGYIFALGIICGLAMQYTKSIVAPTLIHAGADLLIILHIFISYDVKF